MARLKLSLDWNCVIEVEENRAQASAVHELIKRHRAGEIEIALLAVSASENTKEGRFPQTAGAFRERLDGLGLNDIPLVPVPSVCGLTYLGEETFIVGDAGDFRRDTNAIWMAMFPSFDPDPRAHLSDRGRLTDALIQGTELKKWRNRWCDVISAYSHIHAGRDVFVTANTRDFQANAEGLASVGMPRVETPSAALVALGS